MEYDHGDSFPFDIDPNRIPFGSKLKGKLSPRSYPIQCEWKYSFLSVQQLTPNHVPGFIGQCGEVSISWYKYLSCRSTVYQMFSGELNPAVVI